MTALRRAESPAPSSNVVAADAASLMAVINRAAQDPNTDVDKLERLLGMYERITARGAEEAFNAAMSGAQAEIGPVARNAENTQTRSRYATYDRLDRVVRSIYVKHGFSLSFGTAVGAPADSVRVTCRVAHVAGHSRDYMVDMPADGKGAKGGDVMTRTHATGAAMTYGQRYLLKLVFNIALTDEDDDGNAAGLTPISNEQLMELDRLIKESGADPLRFMKYLGVAQLSELPAKRFGEAKNALRIKARNPGGRR